MDLKICFSFFVYIINLYTCTGGFLELVGIRERCPDGVPQGVEDLNDRMETKLFGQHMVLNTVPRLIKQHLSNKNPQRALALSFHGSAGTGKTLASEIIATYIYKGGSSFVHRIQCNKYQNSNKVQEYKKEIEKLIIEKSKLCARSLFIFDYIDDIPHHSMLNVLVPFLDYQSVYRKNIYIFQSHIGSVGINRHFKSGVKREGIPSKELEENILDKCKHSNLSPLCRSVGSLVLVPFLPLESAHVRQCILEDLCTRKNFKCGGKALKLIYEIDTHVKYSDKGVFAIKGCNKITQIINENVVV